MWTIFIILGLIWLWALFMETFVGPVERARQDNYISNAVYRAETEHIMEDALRGLRATSASTDEAVKAYEEWRERGKQKRRERRQRMRANNLAYKLAMEERRKKHD